MLAPSCSTTPEKSDDPAARAAEARDLIEHRQFESATTLLDEIRLATTGTAIGGEVVYLLGKANFGLDKFEEADSYFAAYLAGYPDGPWAEESAYMRALANHRLMERTRLELFRFRKVIPSDRNLEALEKTRTLYQRYLEQYPGSGRSDQAREAVDLLRRKEGEYELQVARFYLGKGHYRAALARAERVGVSGYPDDLSSKARELAEEARLQLSTETGKEP